MKGQKGKKVNQLNAENDNEYAFAVKGDAKHYVTMQSTYKLVALQSIWYTTLTEFIDQWGKLYFDILINMTVNLFKVLVLLPAVKQRATV